MNIKPIYVNKSINIYLGITMKVFMRLVLAFCNDDRGASFVGILAMAAVLALGVVFFTLFCIDCGG